MTNPYQVTTPDRRVALIVGNIKDGVPMHVATRCGGAQGILRFAGTSADDTPTEAQERLRDFMESSFFGCGMENVVLMSGATRVLDADYQTVMTVLELPALIRGWRPSCRTLGSVPRTTATMSLIEDSRFLPSDQLDARVLIHPDMDVAWIVQINASTTDPDYGLDIPVYFDLMDLMRAEGIPTGLVVWGGGTVTAREIREAILRGHPCAIVSGSGRFADDLIKWRGNLVESINPANRTILETWRAEGVNFMAPRIIYSPQQLRDWLREHHFLPPY